MLQSFPGRNSGRVLTVSEVLLHMSTCQLLTDTCSLTASKHVKPGQQLEQKVQSWIGSDI